MRRQRYKVDGDDWLDTYGYGDVREMQREYQLAETGTVDVQTREAMTVKRCGCAFRRGANATVKLPTNRPKVFFQDFIKTNFTEDTFVNEVLEGMNLWSVVCDIAFERTSNIQIANIVVKTELIDGPGETLAYAYFPSGNRLNLGLVFGEEEPWNKPYGTSLKATAGHEAAHNAGVDHDPTGQGLMAAFYNPKVLVPSSKWEIQQMQSRYGMPIPKPQQPTNPVPSPGTETINIRVSGNNLKVVGYERVG